MARRTDRLGGVLEDERVNAGLAWLLVGFLLVVVVENLLDGDVLWAGFAAFVAVVTVVPSAAYRDGDVMLPWEVLVLAALPILAKSLATWVYSLRVTTYLSVAALALIVAVELHAFTTVRMTHWFAILFVVVATTATAGIWAVVQWLSDGFLGTAFIRSEYLLMWDFVYATLAGVVAGVVFELYFRRVAPVEPRLPEGRHEL
ncbi:hypothetical protein [Halomicrococcus sp. NG-SE-24]|uniref:hypothetical protein n=1 Tax=Halomicrococcus sp. NG-SE-24 TaxID=3436928 RepID=UPI003D96903C